MNDAVASVACKSCRGIGKLTVGGSITIGQADCTEHAQKRFQQGIDQTAIVLKTWPN